MGLSDRIAAARSTVGHDDSGTLTFASCSCADCGEHARKPRSEPEWVARARASKLPVRAAWRPTESAL